MPIPGIQQPEVLHVPCQDHLKLRLRKYDGHFNFAWPWYQDPETVRLVDGKTEPYSMERIEKMYTYLNEHGELYFIEIFRNDLWTPVGDVTFWQEDMPIVIGDPRVDELKLKVVKAVKEVNDNYTIHDFRMVEGISHTNLIFDVVLPSSDISDHEMIRQKIDAKIKELDPKFCTVIQIEHAYL